MGHICRMVLHEQNLATIQAEKFSEDILISEKKHFPFFLNFPSLLRKKIILIVSFAFVHLMPGQYL